MLLTLLYVLLILCCVNMEMHSVTYNVHVSRKSRSNASPVQSEYVYSHTIDDPNNTHKTTYQKTPIYNNIHTDGNSGTLDAIKTSEYVPADYESSKMYSNFYPSKMETDALYEHLKSFMHYVPTESEMKNDYYTDRFYNDDNDIRTSSFDSWPYIYQGSYAQMKLESDIAKAKDKRYIPEKTIIPVYEHQDDVPKYHGPFVPPVYKYETTTHNNLHDFVPSEIHDGDALVFNGFAWDKNLDAEDNYDSIDHPEKLKGDYSTVYYHPTDTHYPHYQNNFANENNYANNQQYDKYETGKNNKNNHKEAYEHAGNNQKAFKDITDKFINKHNAEDHNRKSKVALKYNRNKGENRKGFKRVYHKNEYQEDNEFFDNNNQSLSGENAGSSLAHFGGSEAFLNSHSNAALGNEAFGFNKAGTNEHNNYENGVKGYKNVNGQDKHHG